MRAIINIISLDLGESIQVKTPHGLITIYTFKEDKDFNEDERTQIEFEKKNKELKTYVNGIKTGTPNSIEIK